jgi:UDP-N-acetylglucosamine pyrophosphorylase
LYWIPFLLLSLKSIAGFISFDLLDYSHFTFCLVPQQLSLNPFLEVADEAFGVGDFSIEMVGMLHLVHN